MGWRTQFETTVLCSNGSAVLLRRSCSRTQTRLQFQYELQGTTLPKAYDAVCNLDVRAQWDDAQLQWRCGDDGTHQLVMRYPSPLSPREFVYRHSVERTADEWTVANSPCQSEQRLDHRAVLRNDVETTLWFRKVGRNVRVELRLREPKLRFALVPQGLVKRLLVASTQATVEQCSAFVAARSDIPVESEEATPQPTPPLVKTNPPTSVPSPNQDSGDSAPLLPSQWHEEEGEPLEETYVRCCWGCITIGGVQRYGT